MKKQLEILNDSWNNVQNDIKKTCKDIKNWKTSNKLASLPWEDQDVQKLYDKLKEQKEYIEFILLYIEQYLKNGGKCTGFDIKMMDGKSKIEDIKKTLEVCSKYGLEAKDVLQYVTIKITKFRPFFIRYLLNKGYAKTKEEATEIYNTSFPIVRFDERKTVLRLLNENKESNNGSKS